MAFCVLKWLLFSAYAEVFLKKSPYPPPRLRLFSAYAEVFPLAMEALTMAEAFLCLRRGVSQSKRQEKRER